MIVQYITCVTTFVFWVMIWHSLLEKIKSIGNTNPEARTSRSRTSLKLGSWLIQFPAPKGALQLHLNANQDAPTVLLISQMLMHHHKLFQLVCQFSLNVPLLSQKSLQISLTPAKVTKCFPGQLVISKVISLCKGRGLHQQALSKSWHCQDWLDLPPAETFPKSHLHWNAEASQT